MSSYGKRFSEADLEKLLAKGGVQIDAGASGLSPKRKPDTRNEPVATEEAERPDGPNGFAGPVRISYYDRRKRLLDSDNGWTKYFTDALVSAGILRDDTVSEIPERPKVVQEKSKEESLTIVVEAIEPNVPNQPQGY